MSNITEILSRTVTERRDILLGATPEAHRQLIAEGFIHDRLARQYRRSVTERFTVDDQGVIAPIAA
jgi:hypothetical protein